MLYRATRMQDGLAVLLKVPPASRLTPVLLRLLEHEYELARDLDPSRIVRPVALERHAGTVALVLAQGPTRCLAALLDSPMETQRFLQIAIGTAAALAELHRHELVHKDIKPEHVLLDDAGHVWLTGLGIASRLPRERQNPKPPGNIDGTLAYMAPEQTGRMNRSIDSRSDLYALGTTFYQMLTGVLPFSASDPMEWVHCQVARQPLPPDQRLVGVPGPLSELVMKLLAKTAEERYQSAAGVEADLRHCLGAWEANGRIDPFPLGAHDRADRLLIPEKLYGRQSDIDALLAAFDRVASSGTPEFVLVSGYSGVGKTSVVQELHKALVPLRGLFAAGKLDQYKRDIPYATLIQAIRTLIRQILGKSEAEVAGWREALQKAVGQNGQLIIDLIPEVELIIGIQPPVTELPPQEAQNRFRMVLRRFLRGFAGADHPMVLFLDDLQWLDAATLELLHQIAMGFEGRYLLLIGAYRDNEVGPTHPLMRIIDTLRKSGSGMREIVLAPLAIEDVNALIADTLHCDAVTARPLAQLVHEKTAGNPFFVIQFLSALADEKLLAFDADRERWTWDLAQLYDRGFTDNVVDLMIRQLGRLPAATLEALEAFACLGNEAETYTLSLVYETTGELLHMVLWEAVRSGLVYRQEERYSFTHDRVQEAAYALVSEPRRKLLHLKIGRLLFARDQQEQLEERIFDVVDQFNRGIEIITDAEERDTLRRLNTAAGRKARSAAAYISARRYLAQAKALLPAEYWNAMNAQSTGIILELAESEYLSGHFEHADGLLSEVLDHAVATSDRILAYRMRLRLYQISGRFNEAMRVSLEALRLYGIEFPDSDEEIRAAIETEIEQVSVNLHGRQIEDLAEVPLSEDAQMRAIIGLLEETMPLTYTVNPQLWVLINTRGVNLCLQHGNVEEAPFIYSGYAMILVGVVRDIPAAIRFSEMCIRLNERLPRAAVLRGKLLFHHGAVINVWGRPIAENLPLLEQAFQASLDSGDFANAGYLTYNAIWLHLENGDPLEQVAEIARRYSAFADQNQIDVVDNLDRMEEHFVLALQGRTGSLMDFSHDGFDEAACLDALQQSGFGLAKAYHHIMKLVAAYLAGEFALALEWAGRTAPILLQVASMVNEVTYHFYHALTLAALYSQVAPEQQAEFKRTLDEVRQKLRYWADNCPENFSNRLSLVSAELARIEGRDMEAMRFYDEAVQSARDNGFVHHAALACEVAARFYQVRGFDRIADAYLHDARAGYERWGALGKIRQLERHYPRLLKATPLAVSTATFAKGARELDIHAVARASQAISGEILLDNLLKTLMRIVLESAGAQHGHLLLMRKEALNLVVTAHVESLEIVTQVRGEPGFNETALPASILNYVRRSRNQLLLEDTTSPNPYLADDYFTYRHPKSILSFPITKQSRLIGVVYLENDLTAHAFTSDRLDVLKLIAAQAAISLENALVHEALQESEERLRLALEATQIGIFDWDVEQDSWIASPVYYSMLGYPPKHSPGNRQEWLGWVHPDDQAWEHVKGFAIKRDQAGRIMRILGIRMDVTERKLIDDTLFFIAQHGWYAGVENFFQALVQFLGATLDMDCVSIDRIEENSAYAETVALYVKGALAPIMRYARKGTPCETVMEQQLCVYPQGVRRLFPEDTRLAENDAESYIGIPLWDSSGQGIGLISLMSGKPLPDNTSATQVLKLVATRAAAELVRQRSERILREREHEFRTLAENLPDNIVRYDRDARVVYLNPELEKTLGISAADRIGKRIREYHADGSYDAYAEAVDTVLDNGKDMEFEFMLPGSVKAPRIYQMNLIAERDEHGEVTGVLAISREITERKRAEEQIRRLNQELEQRVIDRTAALEAANKELEAFSYSVSHDLRTPLRAINGFSHILLEDYAGQLDDEGKRLLNVVRDSTIRMGQLIDDMLNFSRTGRMEFAFREVDMERVAQGVVEELGPAGGGNKLQVEVKHHPNARGDAAMLRQVYINLLSNAIKFSRDREIQKIEVGAEVKDGETVYYVKDNGVGFDMRYADKLFGVFQRLHSVNEFTGTGIGLAIVKRIISRHGGRVWAQGVVGAGATFYFSLPGMENRHEQRR
ncbi:MAG: AAA family ATPase [Candidatus Thiodiazotropha sp.]